MLCRVQRILPIRLLRTEMIQLVGHLPRLSTYFVDDLCCEFVDLPGESEPR